MPVELNLLVTFVFLSCVLIACTRCGRTYIFAFSIGCILVSNITLPKQVEVFGLSMSLGVVVYSLVYLATDICSEYGGKGDAYRLAISNLIAQIFFLIFIKLSISAGDPDSASTAALLSLFSTTTRISFAAIVAASGAFVDIRIYEYLKQRFPSGILGLLIRNNVSTIIGQGVNTALFFVIAFAGVLENLFQIVLTALIVKTVIAILDTPFLGIAAKFRPKEWSSNATWADPVEVGE